MSDRARQIAIAGREPKPSKPKARKAVTQYDDLESIVGEVLARELAKLAVKSQATDGMIYKQRISSQGRDRILALLRQLAAQVVALSQDAATANREALGNRGADPLRPLSAAEMNAAIARVAGRARAGQWR